MAAAFVSNHGIPARGGRPRNFLPLSIYDEVSGQKGLYQIDEADTISRCGQSGWWICICPTLIRKYAVRERQVPSNLKTHETIVYCDEENSVNQLLSKSNVRIASAIPNQEHQMQKRKPSKKNFKLLSS